MPIPIELIVAAVVLSIVALWKKIWPFCKSAYDSFKSRSLRRFVDSPVSSRVVLKVPPGQCHPYMFEQSLKSMLGVLFGFGRRHSVSVNALEWKFVALPNRGEFGCAVVEVECHFFKGEPLGDYARKFIMQYHKLPEDEMGRVRIVAALHKNDGRGALEIFNDISRYNLFGDDGIPIHAERDLGIVPPQPDPGRRVIASSKALGEVTESTPTAQLE